MSDESLTIEIDRAQMRMLDKGRMNTDGLHQHLKRQATDLERLLDALGVSPIEFELERRGAFELDPRGWLRSKLRGSL